MSNYKLKDKLSYANEGDMVEAQFIELSAPSPKNIPDIAPVKSELMKAMQWASEQGDSDQVDNINEESNKLTGEAIITTMELADRVDVSRVLLHTENMMIKSGLAKVDGENKLTKPLYDQLSIKDIYGLTGAFLLNFIMPSL